MQRKRRAFTLVEILIVITIIAILLIIVVARVQYVTLKAREDNLRENLRHLRLAVALFQTDVGGNPTALDQITLSRDAALADLPAMDATGTPLYPASYHGPYISPDRMPVDPFVPEELWGYDPATGHVYSLSHRTALDGTPYADW